MRKLAVSRPNSAHEGEKLASHCIHHIGRLELAKLAEELELWLHFLPALHLREELSHPVRSFQEVEAAHESAADAWKLAGDVVREAVLRVHWERIIGCDEADAGFFVFEHEVVRGFCVRGEGGCRNEAVFVREQYLVGEIEFSCQLLV